MYKTTLRALEKSIEHWKRLATGNAGEHESIFGSSCALCSLFVDCYTDKGDNCSGCPVSKRTGLSMCNDTPWSAVRNAFDPTHEFSMFTKEFQDAAKVQLKFLRSLRPRKVRAKAKKK